MKKLIFSTLAATTLLSSAPALAGATSPMLGYEYDNIEGFLKNAIWREMRTDLKNKDCYKRAQLWTYELHQKRQIKTRKIFIHYTQKWNQELDQGAKIGFFGSAPDGITRMEKSMAKHNITWDYHVAPLLQIDGEDVVMDKTLPLPYDANGYSRANESAAWDLSTRPSTPEEWVEALTVRGEILWNVRKAKLEEELGDAKNALARAERRGKKRSIKKAKGKIKAIQDKMSYLEMNQDQIDIKCQKVESIADVDANHYNAWCFYSEAPMYHYNEIDLRYRAYGQTGYNYVLPVPVENMTEENFRNGEEYGTRTQFLKKNYEHAQGEIKSSRR